MVYTLKEIDKLYFETSSFINNKQEIKVYKSKGDHSFKVHMCYKHGIGKIGMVRFKRDEVFSPNIGTLLFERSISKIVQYIELGFVILVKVRDENCFRVLAQDHINLEEAKFFCMIRNSKILNKQLNVKKECKEEVHA